MSLFEALCANEPDLVKLRGSIREFLRADRAEFGWQPTIDSWLSRWDEGFSARLADASFLGLTIPTQYGGHGLGHLHRYVVTEELLAAGAPVAAHWVADRQVAPALLAYGTEQQRQQLLPRIASGRFYSAIGMSEHGAGSDLAAAQSKATRTDGGWYNNPAHAATDASQRRLVPAVMTYCIAKGLVIQTNVLNGTGLAFMRMELSVKKPVHVGDTLHAVVTTTEARASSKAGRGVVTARVSVRNQFDDEVMCGWSAERITTRHDSKTVNCGAATNLRRGAA